APVGAGGLNRQSAKGASGAEDEGYGSDRTGSEPKTRPALRPLHLCGSNLRLSGTDGGFNRRDVRVRRAGSEAVWFGSDRIPSPDANPQPPVRSGWRLWRFGGLNLRFRLSNRRPSSGRRRGGAQRAGARTASIFVIGAVT